MASQPYNLTVSGVLPPPDAVPSLAGWLRGGSLAQRLATRAAYSFPLLLAGALLLAGTIVYGFWIPEEARENSWRQTLPLLAMAYGTLFLLAVAILETRFRLVRQKDLLERQRIMGEVLEHLARQRDEERKQISEVLHNNLGGLLTAAKMMVDKVADDGRGPDADVRQLGDLLGQALNEARGMAAVMYPRAMLRVGLLAALEEVVDRFRGLPGAPAIRLVVAPPVAGLSCRTALCTLTLVQEFFVNVVRHAHARHVHIAVDGDERMVQGRVEDDGCGMSPDACGMGLMLCEERVRLLGGSFRVETGDQGTTVCFSIPLVPDEDRHEQQTKARAAPAPAAGG